VDVDPQNAEHLRNTRTAGHINNKWSNAARQLPGDFVNLMAEKEFQQISRIFQRKQRVSTAAGVLCIMLRATRLNHTTRSDVHVSHITNNIISANAAN